MKPTLMYNTFPSNVTFPLTSFANTTPFCSFSTPSLPFVLTCLFLLDTFCLSEYHSNARVPALLTSGKHVFYHQLALSPSSTLHNSANRDVPNKEDRKGWEAGRCISKICSPVKYVPSLNHSLQSSLRSLIKGAVQV